jgi:hypothetical protein
MSKKKHAPHPTPRANRTTFGPWGEPVEDETDTTVAQAGGGAPEFEQDPKRRVGDFEGAGEHPFVQPGGKNGAQRDSGGMSGGER